MNAPLPFQQFQYDFARHIRAPRAHPRPAGVPARRMQVYNDLLFNNLTGFIDACFPVARSMLGERRWRRLCRAFFAEWRSHTPFFREIPREFLRWVMEGNPPFALPPYLVELLHYEWAELAVDVMETPMPEALDLAGNLLDDCPLLNPALMSLAYQWPVQRIGPGFRPRKPAPVLLLVLRRADNQVVFIEINPVSARLVELLRQGRMTGRAALEMIAGEIGHDDPHAVVTHGADLLRNFLHEQVICGVKKCSKD